MRVHHLTEQNSEPSEHAIRLVAVPIRCRCLVPVAKDRYEHFTSKLFVRVNGLLIEDAEIDVICYLKDGRYAQVAFTGTIAVFSTARRLRMPGIETDHRDLV